MHHALAQGADLRERSTIREFEILEPQIYGKERVRRLRNQLGMSQAVFAAALGVSVELVRPWEIGKRQVGALAGRLLEMVTSDPVAFRRRVFVTGTTGVLMQKRKTLRSRVGRLTA